LDPEFANQFGLERIIRINPGVVVAFTDEAVALLRDDTMNNGSDFGMTIGDDVAALIICCLAYNHQVIALQHRLHAIAGDNDISCLSPQWYGRKDEPHYCKQRQEQNEKGSDKGTQVGIVAATRR